MQNTKKYNIFIFISTIARNIIEVFSAVLLYKMGYSIRNILLFYFLIYFVGIFVNYISLTLTKAINPKYILVFSGIMFGITFYYLSVMPNTIDNLIIYSILFAISSYTYHSLRHYFALKVLNRKENNKKVGNILICTYLAIMLSSYFGAYLTNTCGLITVVLITIFISLLSIIPLLQIKNNTYDYQINYKETIKKMKNRNTTFFFLEQFKVIFLSLQPLYLYIYVKNNLEYIGIFNILTSLASIIFVYFFVRKINQNKYFLLLTSIFSIILLFKINITNKIILLIIAFFEGLFTKMYETVSLENIYYEGINKEVTSYLIIAEFIFCFIRGLICLILFIFNFNLKTMLYICIVGIFISGFTKFKRIS